MGRPNGRGPSPAPVPPRYEPFEAGLLREGQREAKLGSLGFDRQVAARLASVQASHGDAWASMPVAELVAELHREASDVGGWSVLLAQHSDLYKRDDEQRLKIRMHLIRVIAAGALVEHEVRQLEHVLGE